MTTAQPHDPTTLVGDMLASASPDRVNSRNGYRQRDYDTRVGTLDVAVPKLLSGSYFPN